MTGLKLLVEGRPGVGKTTLIQRVVARLQQADLEVDGFVTTEIRIGERRVGFEVRPMRGPAAVLAHIDLPGPPCVGRYGVDVPAFERVALPSLRDSGDIVVLDELGKMELASARFVDTVQALVAGERRLLATVHAHRHPVTDRIKHAADVETIHVTVSNRDALVEEITARLLQDIRKLKSS